MMSISTERMIEAADVFKGSYDHVIQNTFGDTHNNVIKFVADIVLRTKPYLLLTHSGLSHIAETVFTNEEHRDFVLMLAFTFFSRFGGPDEDVSGLAYNLAKGAGQKTTSGEYGLIPNQINERLITTEDAAMVLLENKWLMVLLLLQLFVNIPQEEAIKTS
jgi:hypothetical protein